MRKAELENLLVVSSDTIKDYQICARLYDFRHNEKQYERIDKRELLRLRFENTLKRIVSFFFYKKQAEAPPSFSALLNKWERLWFPKDTTAYDLTVQQQDILHGNLASYSTEATSILLKFYEDFIDDTRDPFLIDETFTVPIRRDIHLKGAFDLVLRERNNLTVFKWSTSPRRPSLGSVMIDFAVLKYSFDYRNKGRNITATYGLYDLMSAKSGFVNVDIKEEDLKALLFWANEMQEDNVYPSRRDLTYYCKQCSFYDNICAEWKEWPAK